MTALSLRACAAATLLLVPVWPAGAVTTFSYDELGRVIAVTYSDGKRIAYVYDAAGNRTQVVMVVNGTPVAVNDVRTTPVNTPATFDPRSNDSDPNGDTLTIVATTNGAKGSVAIAADGKSVTYVPNAGTTGADVFSYTIQDLSQSTASATVSVTIGP